MKFESHFKQSNMKETWSGIKKIAGYSKPKSPFPSNPDLNEFNQFYARFDTIDFSMEIADERMERNVSKIVDEYLVLFCLFGFLTSSSATRLYRGWAQRQSA